MTSRDCPCRACNEHTADCHAACERYAGWRKEYEAAKGKERKKLIVDQFVIETSLRIQEHRRRGKR